MNTLSASSQNETPVESGIELEPLQCPDSSVPTLSTRQPFVAYKETNRSSGAWRLRIKSRHDTTAILYPNAIRLQARAASAEGKSSFTWTKLDADRPGHSKAMQLLVHVKNGEPAAIEILPTAGWYSSDTLVPTRFCWPSA